MSLSFLKKGVGGEKSVFVWAGGRCINMHGIVTES